MNTLDNFIKALAPLFAAGFAVQQLLEILTSFFDLDSKKVFQKYKKPILGVVSFAFGCALTAQLKLGILYILKVCKPNEVCAPGKLDPVDFIATALIISAGTEGVNSILKFLKYSKEEKKREGASKDPKASAPAAPAPREAEVVLTSGGARAATEDALMRINRQ